MTVAQAQHRLSEARRAVGIATAALDDEIRRGSPYVDIAQAEVAYRQRFVNKALQALEDARRLEQLQASQAQLAFASTIGGHLAAKPAHAGIRGKR